MNSGPEKLFSRAKAPFSALLVFVFLFVQALAADAHLHQQAHDDAHAPEHQCAATTVAQGQIDLPATGAVLFDLPLATSVESAQAPAVLSIRFSPVDSPRGPPSLA